MTAQKSWWCLLVLATGLSTALLNPTQVNASPDLKDGIKLYQSKNYQAASVIFAAQAKANNDYQAQYYLANCYMAMGQLPLARAAYQASLALTKDAATQAQCQQALAQIDNLTGTGNKRAAAPPAASKTTIKAANSDDEDEQELDPNSPKAKAEKLKSEIMQAAKEKISKIRAAASEQIKLESQQSNTICDYPDGRSALDIPYQRVDEINREAEEKCSKIMNEAELRCRGIH